MNTHAMFLLLLQRSPLDALFFQLREVGILSGEMQRKSVRARPAAGDLLGRAKTLLAPVVQCLHSNDGPASWRAPEVIANMRLAEHYLWSAHATIDTCQGSNVSVEAYQRSLGTFLAARVTSAERLSAERQDGW